MRIEVGATVGVLLFYTSLVGAKHSHQHIDALERRHQHHRREAHTSRAELGNVVELRSSNLQLERRGGDCQFPSDAGLVAVTPDQQNAGWAMSPNQPCTRGNYCPYACPPGQMMAQWNPEATSYSYPQSMDGGLFCDSNGEVSKPFSDKPYCMSGTGNIGAQNKADGVVSFCQTVLPGNEAMLIPTSIEQWETLTVPGPNYWCGTAAHFYINPPGYGSDEACIWGSSDSPIGNWSPYVAGANTVANGETFVKLGWNPVYLEPATPFRDKMPSWGVEIVCDGDGCNGLPCAIDPGTNNVNEMVGANSDGAGGAAFCVVTVPEGVNANFVVFQGPLSGAGKGGGAGSSAPAPASSAPAMSSIQIQQHVVAAPTSAAASSTPTPTPTPTPTQTPTPTSSPAPSSSEAASSSAAAETTSSSSPSSTTPSSAPPTSTLASTSVSSTSENSTSVEVTSSTENSTSTATSSGSTVAYSPHALLQNGTTSAFTSATLVPGSTASGLSGTLAPSASPTLGSSSTSKGAKMHITAAGLGLGVLGAFMAFAL